MAERNTCGSLACSVRGRLETARLIFFHKLS
jgi:hypothetical protein